MIRRRSSLYFHLFLAFGGATLFKVEVVIHKVLPHADSPGKLEPYTCPSCGTLLFEECPSCHRIRHSLLSHCEQCGATKEMK